MSAWFIYYWLAFAISLACCAYIPSKLPNDRNITGSLLIAFLGFALWAFVLAVAYKTYKETNNG